MGRERFRVLGCFGCSRVASGTATVFCFQSGMLMNAPPTAASPRLL